MTQRPKQIHLAAHFPGVNNTTVWSDPRAGSHIELSSFVHFARTAERAKLDFLFLAEGLRLREHGGRIHDLDVVGRPDTFTILSALAAVTDRLGLAGTINSTFNEPYEVARQLASLDHLSRGRAAWNVVTSWDEFTGENFRRGGYLAEDLRYERAQQFLDAVFDIVDSWHGDEVLADKATGEFLATPDAGTFVVDTSQFDIGGRFNVPRSPQGRPVIFQAGDSDQGREFAAAKADAIFSRHSRFADGQAFYADVKGRLAKYGRRPEDLVILPAATFMLGDTDEEARDAAHEVRRQQVSGPTAMLMLEQLWNRDLSAYDPDGPLPDIDPLEDADTFNKGTAMARSYKDRLGTAKQWREIADAGQPLDPRADHQGHRPAVVHRLTVDGRRRDRSVRAGGRQRRLHPGAPHHAGRHGRLRRPRRAAPAGARRVPHRLRGHDPARPPRPRPARARRPAA